MSTRLGSLQSFPIPSATYAFPACIIRYHRLGRFSLDTGILHSPPQVPGHVPRSVQDAQKCTIPAEPVPNHPPLCAPTRAPESAQFCTIRHLHKVPNCAQSGPQIIENKTKDKSPAATAERTRFPIRPNAPIQPIRHAMDGVCRRIRPIHPNNVRLKLKAHRPGEVACGPTMARELHLSSHDSAECRQP